TDAWLNVDPASLENAVLNLVLNARDAMPQGGTVSIEVEAAALETARADDGARIEAGPYLHISIKDSGVGMSTEILAKAFEPFFTTKDVGIGTGLGLSMVYGFVKQS